MARGGYRPGAGRPKKAASAPKITQDPAARAAAAKLGAMTPGTQQFADAEAYLMHVINDATASSEDKLRAAQALLPYHKPKMAEAGGGKKAERQKAAEQAAKGRFAPSAPPKLVVNNGG